ncbi:MAG TPA: hypothetical protein DEA78_25725 [Cyanobacteria bacterium UBA11159]|nr:hypothetical protein [Cyanobacteria bacterium UBA11159]HBS69213.1 hypothetical protein [Cyanobacteria bacterium UBA11153]
MGLVQVGRNNPSVVSRGAGSQGSKGQGAGEKKPVSMKLVRNFCRATLVAATISQCYQQALSNQPACSSLKVKNQKKLAILPIFSCVGGFR